jgi:hypothetical protein
MNNCIYILVCRSLGIADDDKECICSCTYCNRPIDSKYCEECQKAVSKYDCPSTYMEQGDFSVNRSS